MTPDDFTRKAATTAHLAAHTAHLAAGALEGFGLAMEVGDLADAITFLNAALIHFQRLEGDLCAVRDAGLTALASAAQVKPTGVQA